MELGDYTVVLEQLKDAIKNERKAATSKSSHLGKVLVYPQSAEELKAFHPEIYESAYPNSETTEERL